MPLNSKYEGQWLVNELCDTVWKTASYKWWETVSDIRDTEKTIVYASVFSFLHFVVLLLMRACICQLVFNSTFCLQSSTVGNVCKLLIK